MAQAARKTIKAKAQVEITAPVDKLFALREAVINTGLGASVAADAYVKGMNMKFGRGWIEFDGYKSKEIGGNLVRTIEAYKVEKAAFYAAFKSRHAALGRKGEPNPSVYWANFKKIVKKMNAPKGSGSGNVRHPVQVVREDLPSLYLRVNNAADFDTDETAQKIALLLAQALKLAGADLAAINEKIG